jgi:hypothetical protein
MVSSMKIKLAGESRVELARALGPKLPMTTTMRRQDQEPDVELSGRVDGPLLRRRLISKKM